MKDPKFKISKVTHCLNKEREKLSKMSKFITNPKTAKEKKKGASTSSKQIMDDEELEDEEDLNRFYIDPKSKFCFFFD